MTDDCAENTKVPWPRAKICCCSLEKTNVSIRMQNEKKKKDLFSLTEARHKSRHLLLILEQSPKRQLREGTDCLVFRSAIKTFSALETAKSLGCCI